MSRTAAPARTFGAGRSRVDSFEIISAPPRNPAVRVLALLVRLRAELFVLAVLVTVWVLLAPDQVPGRNGDSVAVPGTGFDPTGRALLLGTVVVVLAVVPWTRRFLFHRAQAVVTRHRVRQALVECRVLNSRSRACPLTVWARPTRVGEVVWVVLRAGLSPKAVQDQAEELAATCFAREARVTAWPSMTNIVRVEIIRRDPLAPSLIRSELFRWASGDPHEDSSSDGRPVVQAPRSEPTRAALTAGGSHDTDTTDSNGGGRDGDWSDYV